MRGLATICWILCAGCAGSPFDREAISAELTRRTDHALPPAARSAPADDGNWNLFPPGTRLDDGISEDEAVAIALWNNAAFLADLQSLELSRADLLTAGMIRNPVFTLLLPLGPKQLEFSALIPIEELWQRPRRVAAAQADVERVANSLVQTGLDLVRDTRFAFADLVLAQKRAVISARMLHVRQEVARIATARHGAGDISALEAEATRLDAVSAEAEGVQLERARSAAREALWRHLGLGQRQIEIPIVEGPPDAAAAPAAPEAVARARVLRPDLRGAELAIEAAGGRLGWEKARIFNAVSVIADANGSGSQGFEIGPGLSIELPLFNQNQGGRARAHADLERAAWRYVALRQQVEAEVRAALLDRGAAQQALGVLHADVLAAAERNVERAQKAFTAGDASYLAVLDAMRQLLDVRLRESAVQAALQRSVAQLDRSIGSRREVP